MSVQYPVVPVAPGVPPVQRIAQATDVVTLVASDAAYLLRFFSAPKWGVFDQSGNVVLQADTVIAVDFRREFRISDYPIEQGAFASYDKVTLPYDVRVVFAIGASTLAIFTGGQAARRTAFLKALDAASESLNLYNVATPEVIINNVNLVRYSYTRGSDKSSSMIVVDVDFRWVRTSVTSQYTQTQQPSGQAQQNQGTVQTTPAPSGTTITPGPGFDDATTQATPSPVPTSTPGPGFDSATAGPGPSAPTPPPFVSPPATPSAGLPVPVIPGGV